MIDNIQENKVGTEKPHAVIFIPPPDELILDKILSASLSNRKYTPTD
jgi:hypothetical protein